MKLQKKPLENTFNIKSFTESLACDIKSLDIHTSI